jgi:hypothetical protein
MLLRKTSLFVMLGVGVLAGAVYFVYSCSNPADRVKVTVRGLTAETYFVSLVSESVGVVQNMPWYPRHVLGPFTMHPAGCSWSYHNGPVPLGNDWNACVQWRRGERYGVVTRAKDLSWCVTWFAPESATIIGALPLLGGGQANFDLALGKTEPLPERLVQSLELTEVLAPD